MITQSKWLLENKLVDEFNQGGKLVRRWNSTLRKLVTLKNRALAFLWYVSKSDLGMDELKSLARWGRKLLLSKICRHNLEWEESFPSHFNSTSICTTYLHFFVPHREAICLQVTGKMWWVWNYVWLENALEGSQLLYSLTALTPLLDRGEVLIIALGEVDHHVLAALGQLPHTPARRPRIPEKYFCLHMFSHQYNITCWMQVQPFLAAG